MRPMSFRLVQLLPCFGLLIFILPILALGSDEDLARQLLSQALENQYRGRYSATLEIIDESFPSGRDSLSGQIEFSDEVGERRICLAGSKKSFDYRSFNFGKEQWITDDESHRIRRIANRQCKKVMFGTLLTYEDMLKLPVDFFLEYSSCKGIKAVDSTYQLSLLIKPIFQSFYSRLEVTLSKNPVLLKTMTFYGQQQQKLKSMEVLGYKQAEGKWLISDLTVFDCDSLSRVQMSFRHFSFNRTPIANKSKLKAPNINLINDSKPYGSESTEELGLDGLKEDGSEEVSN
jgi:hypothetical protein